MLPLESLRQTWPGPQVCVEKGWEDPCRQTRLEPARECHWAGTVRISLHSGYKRRERSNTRLMSS